MNWDALRAIGELVGCASVRGIIREKDQLVS